MSLSGKQPGWRHQLATLAFALQLFAMGRRGVMLALAMGLGKTKVAIDLAHEIQAAVVLVVCPLRVVDVWREQLERHASYDYLFCGLDDNAGTVAQKASAAREAIALGRASKRTTFIVINYEAVWRDPFASFALHTAWPLIICDEIHRIKQASGKVSRFLGRLGLRASYRIGLTGTPLPHSPLDAWAQYRFLDPSVFDPTHGSFCVRYAKYGGFQKREIVEWINREDFRRRFFSIAYRVSKEEALDLPPKMDLTLRAPLSPKGRRTYERLESDFLVWLGETPEEQLTVKNALVLLIRLQQLTGGTLKDDQGIEHTVDASKEDLLADWLEDLPPDEPVVIFANFIADLDAIHRASERAGHRSVEVSGRSPHGIQEWKAGKANILAAQIHVAGEGQDFTRAAYAVFYSTGFRLSSYLQARDRIHRPGQTRAVTYVHLVITHTIDEIVQRAIENRWELVENILKELKPRATRRQSLSPIAL